ncbi:Carbonic anhydrase [Halotydeus destructor]|nr:Carbonic anhydrase [Halotydeus destructor]
MVKFAVAVVAVLATVGQVYGAGGGLSHHELNYFEQHKWPLHEDAQCGGSAQSPIDINTRSASYEHAHIALNHYDTPYQWEIINNGHADQADIIGSPHTNQLPTLKFKGQTFQFEQLHFHWGPNDKVGSEHTINGNRYPLEIHVVHHNTKYANVTAALGHDLGVLVFGSMVEIDPYGQHNWKYAHLADTLNSIADVEGHKVNIPTLFPLQDLMPSNAAENVYMYTGSLTTPPCTQKVQWVMSAKAQYLSKAQMAQFRQLRRSDNVPVAPNYREIQPLNGRKITKNF